MFKVKKSYKYRFCCMNCKEDVSVKIPFGEMVNTNQRACCNCGTEQYVGKILDQQLSMTNWSSASECLSAWLKNGRKDI